MNQQFTTCPCADDFRWASNNRERDNPMPSVYLVAQNPPVDESAAIQQGHQKNHGMFYGELTVSRTGGRRCSNDLYCPIQV